MKRRWRMINVKRSRLSYYYMTYSVKWIALIDRHLEVCLKLIKGCYLKNQRKKENTIFIIRLDTYIGSVICVQSLSIPGFIYCSRFFVWFHLYVIPASVEKRESICLYIFMTFDIKLKNMNKGIFSHQTNTRMVVSLVVLFFMHQAN